MLVVPPLLLLHLETFVVILNHGGFCKCGVTSFTRFLREFGMKIAVLPIQTTLHLIPAAFASGLIFGESKTVTHERLMMQSEE
jgi:hypothetical protein